MKKNPHFIRISSVLMGIAFGAGCAIDDPGSSEEVAGVESTIEVEPLATLSSAGLQFASAEIARQWVEEAPGVWRHEDGTRRMILGEEGHRWAVAQLDDELAALNTQDADESLIEAKEAHLAVQRTALDKAGDEIGTEATCNIGLYTGASGPIFGFVGSAALAQLSCQNGTVVFTVESQACTGSTGCGPYSVQTAIPDSTPRLWGSLRSGTGNCFSTVFVSPPGIGQSSNFTCG
jgi:hypothetical protein